MVARITALAFEGAAPRPVDVQAQLSGGLPGFAIVGLPDKAVAESRERVRAALEASGLGLPPKRLVVHLAPADLPKEGGHFDLAIALAILMEMGVLAKDAGAGLLAVGELSLDARLAATPGALPAALAAADRHMTLVCPAANGPEAAWADPALEILAAPDLVALLNHLTGRQTLPRPAPGDVVRGEGGPDLADVRGQERAKRALEIAAAGGHHLVFSGPPGSGKSMMASRMAGLLPLMSSAEILETSTVASLAGLLEKGRLSSARPFRAPHHSASMAAMVGGGVRAKPGEASLAHNGVLFLDELPEFAPQVIDALRQPLETGDIIIARINARARYPARFQLIAAMNPCRCGWAGDALRGCPKRAEECARRYQARLSGPFLDRMDMFVRVDAVAPKDLASRRPGETSNHVAARVAEARAIQGARFEAERRAGEPRGRPVNADAPAARYEEWAALSAPARDLLFQAAERFAMTARGFHRAIKVARTIADLEGAVVVERVHAAEALSYRDHAGAATPGRSAGSARAA